MVMAIQRFFGFFFIFGAYSSDLGDYAKLAGFSIAMNWCICGPPKQARVVQRINRKPLASSVQPA